MTALLETLLEEGFATVAKAEQSTRRQVAFPENKEMIKVAIGMRRSGKTTLLYQTIHTLLSQGVEYSQILLINFEDDRLLPMSAQEMGKLIDDFYQLYPENHQRECYLFLDEVQNVPDWHVVVRRFFDSKNVQIYLTGSSATLLSKEINTRLRGRSLAREVLPYDFREYLSAHQQTLPGKPFGKAAFDILHHHLLQYFATGGFPGVQHLPPDEWREVLQSYVDTVILKDIMERHQIKNISLLRYLTLTLLKNAAARFSINKFHNDLKSQGYRVNKDTLHQYMTYIEDSFLIFRVSHYSASERLKQTQPKKIYVIDYGLLNAISLPLTKDQGRALENLVYLDLRRQGKTVYYYTSQQGYEIDFVTVALDGTRELIQVTWDMSDPQTAEREQRALAAGQAELGLDGRIITVQDYLRAFL